MIYGTAFSGCVIAGEVILEGGSKSSLRGEDEDELEHDIEDMLGGEPEHDSIVESVFPDSKEVCTCVEAGMLGESGGLHFGEPNVSVSFFLYLQSASTP